MTLLKMPDQIRITFTLFLLWFYQIGNCQNRLFDIEKEFETKGIIINNEIENSIITNDFPIFRKISQQTFNDHELKIGLSNVTVKGNVDYYKNRFRDSVTFEKVRFVPDFNFSLSVSDRFVSFDQSLFQGKAIFSWAQFKTDAIFSWTQFKTDAFFDYVIFNEKADFFESQFHKHADFYAAQFKKPCNFAEGCFSKTADFSFSEMEGDINFKNAEFNIGLFNNSKINGSLNFYSSKFDTLLDLSGSAIAGRLIFNNVTLPLYLNLSNVESLDDVIDLTEIKATRYKTCFINLVNTDVSKIKFHYENFQLWFPPNTAYNTKCAVYDELLSSFKLFGFKTGYQKLDIEYCKYRYYYHQQYIIDMIQMLWWNYGYSKGRIFVWLFRIVFILTIINSLFIYSLMGNIYEIKYLNFPKVKARRYLYHPILAFFLNVPTSFLYTIILVAGGAFGIQFSTDHIRLPSFMGMIYIISIGVFGISCSAFILNLIFDL